MMREELTKESYGSLFDDSFELTHYAIGVARKRIVNGDEDLNVAHLLREIRRTLPKRLERKTEQ